MAAETTTPRRRKIFPHLDEETKKSSSASLSDDAKAPADKNGDTKAKSQDSSYDNAKSKKKGSKHPSAARKASKKSSETTANENKNDDIPNDAAGSAMHHLIPLPLVLTVLVCSGLFWIASFRDVMATGKPILDTMGVLWGQDDADANFL
ncbi:hypothetical protein ACHAXR_007958, partial [Thalassiosira sp. AJA248-18]